MPDLGDTAQQPLDSLAIIFKFARRGFTAVRGGNRGAALCVLGRALRCVSTARRPPQIDQRRHPLRRPLPYGCAALGNNGSEKEVRTHPTLNISKTALGGTWEVNSRALELKGDVHPHHV